jgi:hypothetical protein
VIKPESIVNFQAQVNKLRTDKEKISYCAQIIYDTHNLLRDKNLDLARDTRNKALGIIETAENQLLKLIKK